MQLVTAACTMLPDFVLGLDNEGKDIICHAMKQGSLWQEVRDYDLEDQRYSYRRNKTFWDTII